VGQSKNNHYNIPRVEVSRGKPLGIGEGNEKALNPKFGIRSTKQILMIQIQISPWQFGTLGFFCEFFFWDI
jgi:hypothetical protein